MTCYLCGGRELDVITTQLRNGAGTVLLCRACDLGQLCSSAESTSDYYRERYRELHGPRLGVRSSLADIFDSYVNYQTPRIERIRPWLDPAFRLLEVGCSTGHFLYHVRRHVGEVVGVDYDADAARFAAERCGCRTFGGLLDDAPLEPHSFDVVVALQTLEHVADPIAFVSNLRRYLKPGGILYLEVPNLSDPLRAVYGNRPYETFYFHEAHLFYFSARSLLAVVQRAGFAGSVYPTQTYNFMNHLHWVLNGTPQPSCHAGLGVPTLPVSSAVDDSCRADLAQWAETADREYKAILARHGATDDLSFIGNAQPS